MRDKLNETGGRQNRRRFLTTGLAVAGAAAVGIVLPEQSKLAAQSSSLTAGDVAILQFLAAGEALEADFYTQYNELGGIQDDEVPGGSDDRIYAQKLRKIDRNFSQYIHDITDDEMSHQNFINAYLVSKGPNPLTWNRSAYCREASREVPAESCGLQT